MPKFLFIIFWGALTISACSSVKKQQIPVQIQQGIEGYVYRMAGNFMPAPDMPPRKPNGIATKVYIYEATNLKDVERIGFTPSYQTIHTKLISTVQSDSTGHFAVELPVGSYSLFIKVNDHFYANAFDVANNISLTKVTEHSGTHVEIRQSAAAVF